MGLSRLKQISIYIAKRFYFENFSDRAAALVYTTLLSLVPLGLVGLAILSSIPGLKNMNTDIQAYIFANFVTESAQTIVEHLQGFMQRLPDLSTTNLIALGLVSLLTIFNVSNAFNAIWKVDLTRKLTKSIVIYILILILTPILMGLGFVMSSFLVSLPLISDADKIPYFYELFLWLIPYFLAALTFTLLNWILPICKVPFKAALMGGVITAVLFELAKYGFTWYLSHFPSYVLLYGALAAIPIFLVWLFISWTIVLLGGMITYVIATGEPKGIN